MGGGRAVSVRCTYDEDVEQQHRHANHCAQLNAIDRLVGEANPKTSQAHQNEVHDIGYCDQTPEIHTLYFKSAIGNGCFGHYERCVRQPDDKGMVVRCAGIAARVGQAWRRSSTRTERMGS